MIINKYPLARVKDVEEVVEKMAQENEGKVNIDEFIDLLCSCPPVIPFTPESRTVLSIKAQRVLLPSDYMNYFNKISASELYGPSLITSLHEQMRNLPSESFKLVRDNTGIWYRDIKPIKGITEKPTDCMQQIEPDYSGYIILNKATGIPIQSINSIKRENIVNRMVKVYFFNNEDLNVVHGSVFVQAEWDKKAEYIWNFNPIGKVGTNPLVFKWVNEEVMRVMNNEQAEGQVNIDPARKIDIIFELVSTVR